MRILWDLRLFSYGYGSRGVGAYVSVMARAVGRAGIAHEIVAWGDRGRVPSDVAAVPQAWIPYGGGSWKGDLARIPLLVVRHRIDLIHYWIAMGPVFHIGMGMFPPCAVLATVYDLGVENNPDSPYCAHARRTWYWRFQKLLLRRAGAVACISRSTRLEVERLLGGPVKRIDVIYPPVEPGRTSAHGREDVFVTFAGGPHKNLSRVLEAFSALRDSHKTFRLVVLGEIESGGAPDPLPAGVVNESMKEYEGLLETAAGLVMCSTYEGLGLPPLSAMAHGCPLVLSDIAPLRETCEGAALFVCPTDPRSITSAMAAVADDRKTFAARSAAGYVRYAGMSGGAPGRWAALYDALGAGKRGM
jgi:glycosyltransferase involved in cell wall biosynthesis